MKTRLLLLLIMAPLVLLAQQKTYDIALSYGGYTSPSFKQQQSKGYFSADFDYHFTHQWTISSGFMTGQFGYYDDIPVKLPNGSYADNPNSTGHDLHGYVMAKYSVLSIQRLTLQIGAGVGFLSKRLDYLYNDFIYQDSQTNVEFPLSFEGYYLVSKRVGFGMKAGCFAQPDFPMLGLHLGPQIRIRL